MSSIEANRSKPIGRASVGLEQVSEMEVKAAYISVVDNTSEALASKKQLMHALQFSGRNPSIKQIDKVWKQYADNGSVNYSSFMRIMREIKLTTKQQLLQAFRKIDLNNDGYITHTELYRVFTSKGEKLTHSEVQKIIESVDRNKDGKLDYDEFADLFMETSEKCRELALDNVQGRQSSPNRHSPTRPLSASSGRQTPRSSRTFTSSNDIIEEDYTTVTKDKKKSSFLDNFKGSSRPNSAKKSSRPSSAVQESSHSRPSSAKKDLSSTRKDVKITDNTISVKGKASWDVNCSLQEPKSLKEWNRTTSKGCFYIDEDVDMIVTHHYLLELTHTSNCYITIEPYSLTRTHGSHIGKNNNRSEGRLVNAVDTCLLIVQEPKSSFEAPEVVGFTTLKSNQQYRWQGDLRSGIYRLIPFTSGCRLRKRTQQPDDEIELIRKDQHGEMQLSRAFRETLSDFFEMCDLDGNGLLNKSEFGWFQILTGDEFDDESWKVVQDNFELKKGELTREGFVELHLMQAREEDGDPLEELHMVVSSMGYTKLLDMDQACPFKLNVYTKDSRARLDVSKLSTKRDEVKAGEFVAEYVARNNEAKTLKSVNNGDVFVHRNAANVISVIENKSSKMLNISIDNSESSNCLCSNEIGSVKIEPLSKLILDKAVAKNEKQDWFYRCTVEEKSVKGIPKPAERKKNVAKKNSLLSIF